MPRGVDPCQVGVARRRRMIGFVKAEESPACPATRHQSGGGGLDHGAGELVLEPAARQVERRIERAAVAIGRAEKLHRVGGESGRALAAAMRNPGMAALLRQVLPAHHDRPAFKMVGDVVVDILRGIGLVVHQERTLAEAHILHEQDIAGRGLRAAVDDLRPPQPERQMRVQPQRHLVAQARALALPDEAILGGAQAQIGISTGRQGQAGRRCPDAQIKAGDAAVQRRALDQAHPGPATLMPVLDGEQAPVGEQADRQPGPAGDMPQAESARSRGGELADGGACHARSPSSLPVGAPQPARSLARQAYANIDARSRPR